MKRRFIFPLVLALLPGIVLAGMGGIIPGPERAIDYRTRVWSDTRPAINLTHIFAGEINRRGKPVGFHSRPGGVDPARQRRCARRRPAQPRRASTPPWSGSAAAAAPSSRPCTPTACPARMVIAAILAAFRHGQRRGERFRGPSGLGFTIEGYFQNGRIHTAYPIYTR